VGGAVSFRSSDPGCATVAPHGYCAPQEPVTTSSELAGDDAAIHCRRVRQPSAVLDSGSADHPMSRAVHTPTWIVTAAVDVSSGILNEDMEHA